MLQTRKLDLIPFITVRARMVSNSVEYRWSNYLVKALGIDSDLCIPHEIDSALGQGVERLAAYGELFAAHVDEEPIAGIREGTRRDLAPSHERFIREMEARTGARLRAGKPGPPPERNHRGGSAPPAVGVSTLILVSCSN